MTPCSVPSRVRVGDRDRSAGDFSSAIALSPSLRPSGSDIWLLSLEGERKARPFLQTRANEAGGVFLARLRLR